MPLKDKLKLMRTKYGYSQEKVADLINVGRRTISDYERGISSPDPETIAKLSKLYDVSSDYLLDLSDNPNPIDNNDLQLDEFEFALYGEVKELTEEQKQTILNMAKFLKDSNK